MTITTKVVEGRPARVLLDEAAGAELLVVGTRGLGGAAQRFLGSTSHACAHRSPVPVVIVPADRQQRKPQGDIEMRVRDLMSSDLEVVRPDTSYKELVERMLARNVSGLPVVDEHDSLVGIVTEADVIRRQAWGEGERNRHRHRALALVDRLLSGKEPTSLGRIVGLTAGDIMSRRVVTASPDDDLRQAARTMLIYGVKRLPVVSDGRLVGLISRADLMRYFGRPDADIAADVERTLADPLSAPKTIGLPAPFTTGWSPSLGRSGTPVTARWLPVPCGQSPGVVDVRDEPVAREAEPGLDNLHVPLGWISPNAFTDRRLGSSRVFVDNLDPIMHSGPPRRRSDTPRAPTAFLVHELIRSWEAATDRNLRTALQR